MKQIALLGLVVALGCSKEPGPGDCTPSGDSCSANDECCAGDLCTGWQCATPASTCKALDQACEFSSECCGVSDPVRNLCVENRCSSMCTSNNDCTSGCCARTSIDSLHVCADMRYCQVTP